MSGLIIGTKQPKTPRDFKRTCSKCGHVFYAAPDQGWLAMCPKCGHRQ